MVRERVQWVCLDFLATGSQVLAFQCDREACSVEFNACHDKSIHNFLTCSVCLLMMRSECVCAFGEGSNFQLVRGPQN